MAQKIFNYSALFCITSFLCAGFSHAAQDVGAIPVQTYTTYSETEEGYSLALQNDGKAKMSFVFYGDVSNELGTWKQDGTRITVNTLDKKTKKKSVYLFEYKNELRSSSSNFNGCKKFPDGLMLISIDNTKLPVKQSLNYYSWPDKYVKQSKGPCLQM